MPSAVCDSRAYPVLTRMYRSSVISRPQSFGSSSSARVASLPAAANRPWASAAVRPAPVCHRPSTRTSRPVGVRRAAHRSKASIGCGNAQRTCREMTASYFPAGSEGAAASPEMESKVGPRRSFPRRPFKHAWREVHAVHLVTHLGEKQRKRAGSTPEICYSRRCGREHTC